MATGLFFLANGNTGGFAEVLSGGKWKLYTLPGLAGNAYSAALENVSCVSAVNCVAVGSYGTHASPGGTPSDVVFAEYWNGRKWSRAGLPVPAGSQGAWLYDVSCAPSSRTCMATGGRGLGNGRSGALAESLSAGRWKATTPFATGGDPSLFGVSCVSATSCVATGGGDTAFVLNNALSDAWNGRTWRFAKLPTPSQGGSQHASAVWSVSCLSAKNCVGVGSAGTTSGLVYGFSGFWNGKGWHLVPLA